MSEFILKIKRGDTPFYAWLNKTAKAILRFSIPSYKPIHIHFYRFHVLVREILHRMWNNMWCVPAFAAQCVSCGARLQLPNGMPLVGGNIQITLGDDVHILDSTLASGYVYDAPELIIGDRVTVGYHSDISVGQRVEIGNNVKIAKDCYIADNDGHPLDPARRHQAVNKNEIRPVKIGNNVWIGTGCSILKGVTIGDNTVVAANSVVTAGVLEPNAIYAGSPAKFIKYIDGYEPFNPPELFDEE